MGLFDRIFKKRNDPPKVEERNFFNIAVGDFVSYELEDYQVVGKLSYNDHGFKWFAYQIKADTKSIWLAVEMDDELELGIYERINLKLNEPIPDRIDHNGITYHLSEKGTAVVKGEGQSQNVNGVEVRYFDFSDEDEENFLSVEQWGSEIEVSVGYEIDDFDIKVIAGS